MDTGVYMYISRSRHGEHRSKTNARGIASIAECEVRNVTMWRAFVRHQGGQQADNRQFLWNHLYPPPMRA